MLSINKITKKYEDNEIFKDLSTDFYPNRIYRIEGPNGIGKTTLLKIIKGIVIEDSGEILYKNKEISKDKIAYVDSNHRSFFHRLSVHENILYFLAVEKINKDKKYIKELFKQFKLENLIDINFSLLSTGQMQLISIIRCFLKEPQIILLDEVFSNLDKDNINRVCSYLTGYLKEEDRLVLICNHGVELPLEVDGVFKLS